MTSCSIDWLRNSLFESSSNEIPDDLLFAELSKPNPTWMKVKDYFGPDFENFVPINGKTFANKTLKLPTEGVYGLKSQSTMIGAYSYGFGPYDSYGYPTAAIFNDIQFFDPKAPEIVFTSAKDADFIAGSVDETHEGSSGLSQFYMIESMSSNYNFEITSIEKGVASSTNEETVFIPGVTKKLNWSLEKMDTQKEGYAVLYLSDRSGNDGLHFFGNTITTTSVEPEQTLSEYMIVTQSEITILPKAISERFSELSIFNLEGNKVMTSDLSSLSVSLSNLQSGTYIITLKSEDRLLTRKINVVK